MSDHGDVSFNLATDGNHLLPDKENMVDGAFLQTRIQVQRLVQHVTCEQVHCHARIAVPWSTFLGTSV